MVDSPPSNSPEVLAALIAAVVQMGSSFGGKVFLIRQQRKATIEKIGSAFAELSPLAIEAVASVLVWETASSKKEARVVMVEGVMGINNRMLQVCEKTENRNPRMARRMKHLQKAANALSGWMMEASHLKPTTERKILAAKYINRMSLCEANFRRFRAARPRGINRILGGKLTQPRPSRLHVEIECTEPPTAPKRRILDFSRTIPETLPGYFKVQLR